MIASSPYFKALFGPNFIEGNSTEEIVLNGIDGNTLVTVIDYCTTGIVQITNKNVDELLLAASTMNLIKLENLCSKYLERNLSINNFLSTLIAADMFSLTALRKNVSNFFGSQFNKIPRPMIMFLSINQFIDLMKTKRIVVSEERIFEYIFKYIQRNCEGFHGVERKLFDCLDLKCLSERVSENNSKSSVRFFDEIFLLQFMFFSVLPLFEAFDCLELIRKENYRRNEECGTIYVEASTQFDIALVQRVHLENFDLEVQSESRSSSLENQWMARTVKENKTFSIEFLKYEEEFNCFVKKNCVLVHNDTRRITGIVYHQNKLYCFGGYIQRKYNLRNVSEFF